MPKIPQKRQKTLIRRKQIISALRKLIIKYGSENVTVARVAKEIGVTQGAIYRHFKSKREILGFLVDNIEENLIGDLEKAVHHSSALESLEFVLKNHVSAIEQKRGVSFLVIAEIVSLGDKWLNSRVFGVLTRYIARIKEVLLRGIKSGELRPEVSAEIAATMFFSAIQGFVTLWALSNYDFSLEEKYSGLWNFFRQAVSHE